MTLRKILFIVLGVVAVVFVVTRVKLPSPSGAPPPGVPAGTPLVAAAPGQGADDVKLICASGNGVYWVSQPKDKPATLLHARRAGQAGRPVATAAAILSVIAQGRDVLYLTEEATPGSGQLWRVRGQGAPQSLAQGLRAPQGLLAADGQIIWTETRPSPAPGLACVPVLQPLSLIMRAGADGQGKALLAVSESAEAHFTGKLLGVRDGRLYWLQLFGQQYARPTTMICRAPVTGGAPEQLVRADGPQDAALGHGALFWTAPSEEMSPPLSGRTVRRAPLSAAAAATTLTDWMSPDGTLFLLGQKPYYCDRAMVWRIPRRLGEAAIVAQPKLDPGNMAEYRGALYSRAKAGEGTRLVRVPLTPGARLRGLVGP